MLDMSNRTLDKTSAKILVLGDSGVGKSSLIHLICHSTTLSSPQWTIGCAIDIKLFGNCFLEFWDIGGSRTHKIARSFLYQDYHGIMLVFDATNKKSRLNLNEWLMEVAQKGNEKDLDAHINVNVPTITIGTKKDQLPYRALVEIEQEFRDASESSVRETNSSVVNFDVSSTTTTLRPTTSNPYRRFNSSGEHNDHNASFLSTLNTSTPSLGTFSHSKSAQSAGSLNAPLLGSTRQPVIYVNTQDVLSFSHESNNYAKLINFFRIVVERRSKRFCNNKFAI